MNTQWLKSWAGRGFVLVELLVVVSLITLMTSLVLPGLNRAQQQTRRSVCMSNLRQITMSAIIWGEEHDGWCVGYYWYAPKVDLVGQPIFTSLEPYTGSPGGSSSTANLYTCPACPFPPVDWRIRVPENPYVDNVTYGTNYQTALDGREGPGIASPRLFRDGVFRGTEYGPGTTKLATIRRPAATIYFMDHVCEVVDGWNLLPRGDGSGASQNEYSWHDGRANVAFFDGRVEREPADFLPRWSFYIRGR